MGSALEIPSANFVYIPFAQLGPADPEITAFFRALYYISPRCSGSSAPGGRSWSISSFFPRSLLFKFPLHPFKLFVFVCAPFVCVRFRGDWSAAPPRPDWPRRWSRDGRAPVTATRDRIEIGGFLDSLFARRVCRGRSRGEKKGNDGKRTPRWQHPRRRADDNNERKS